MEEKENNEQKVEKRKTNWVFTIFTCIATGIIVFLAMNLGDKAGKIIDPETNKTSSNVTSNSNSDEANSNEISNENSDVSSNISSNVTSNDTQTSNVTTNNVSVRTYRFFGYTGDNGPDMYTTLKLYFDGKYDLYVNQCSAIGKYSGTYNETNSNISLTGSKNITFTKEDNGNSLKFNQSDLSSCSSNGGTFGLESHMLGD